MNFFFIGKFHLSSKILRKIAKSVGGHKQVFLSKKTHYFVLGEDYASNIYKNYRNMQFLLCHLMNARGNSISLLDEQAFIVLAKKMMDK